MKRNFTLLTFIFVLCTSKFIGQSFNGIGLTGFKKDVIAETLPALASTTSTIEANYVLFSSTYSGTVATMGGLLASRVYTTSTRTYSLAPYNQNNTIAIGFNLKDSVSLVTPGNYSVISLLGFSTVSDATADITLKYTDGTSVLYSSQNFYNWTSSQPSFIMGLGKTNRVTDAIYYTPSEPKMYSIDLPVACVNQSKMLSKIVVKNNTNNAVLYVFSASAVNRSSYTSSSIPVICKGVNNGSAKVFGIDSYGPLTYTWTSLPVQNTQTATNLNAGDYTVTINDGNGCTYTSSVTITEPATTFSVTSISSNSLNCATAPTATAAVIVNGGTAPYTYSWTNTAANVNAVGGLPAGNFTVFVTDAIGCSITATSNIAAPVVNITVSTSSLLCGSVPNATATVSSVSGTSGPYTYTWTTSPVQTSTIATGITAGTFSVNVKDGAGCVYTKAFTIVGPSFNITTSPTTCTLSAGSATISGITGGSGGPYTYSWSTLPVQTTANASGIPAGIYTASVTDGGGCVTTKTVSISSSNLIVGVTTTSLACSTLANGSASVTLSGGAGGPYTYTWSSSPVQTTATASNLPAGSFSVKVVGASGCATTQTFTIDKPSLTISTTPSACQNFGSGSATVIVNGGTGPYLYYWDGSITSGSSTISGLEIQTYNLAVVDANSCLISGTFNITGPTGNLSAIVSTSVTTCSGINDGKAKVVATSGTPPYAYSWNTNPPQNSPLAIGLASPKTYTCTIIDYNNCFIRKAAYILPAPLNINIVLSSPSNSICPGTSVKLSVAGATSYTWSTGANTSSVNVTPPGTSNTITTTAYSFTGTTTQSCIVTGSTSIITTTAVGGCVLGVEEQAANSFNLYPNPNTDKFTLKLNNTYTNSVLEVIDALGKIVISQTVVSDEIVVNTSSLQNGIYFVLVRNENRIIVKTKIIKQ